MGKQLCHFSKVIILQQKHDEKIWKIQKIMKKQQEFQREKKRFRDMSTFSFMKWKYSSPTFSVHSRSIEFGVDRFGTFTQVFFGG
jgi:hypothetical protein